MDNEDWLKDPLLEINLGSYKYRKLKSSGDKQNTLWTSRHFAIRLKLDGADFFCRQVLGAVSMPDDQGAYLLTYRLLDWNLSAFFFELMSAYDTLLQELNIVYAYDSGLKPEDVYWDKIKDKLPQKVADYMNEEWEKEWFDKVRRYRNMATHHYLVPKIYNKAWWGNNTLDASHNVLMNYRDKEGNFKSEDINTCKDYLKNMAKYISSIWQKMAQEFQ